MSTLKSIEKLKFERYFQMEGGYVCDFVNKTFKDFVLESSGIDLYTPKYLEDNSGSKANLLRAFWDKEPNYVVARVLDEMIEYWRSQLATGITGYKPFNAGLYEECKKITTRLKSSAAIDDLEALIPNSGEHDFVVLARNIKESIEKDEPGHALDRLHTFVVKYLRKLCANHSIFFDKSTPLNALIGGYVKYLHENKLIDSEMSKEILRSSIHNLQAFDKVRNDQSLAHDNPVLNYGESILIFNNISNTIRFIQAIEKKIADGKDSLSEKVNWEDISFDNPDDSDGLTLDEALDLGLI